MDEVVKPDNRIAIVGRAGRFPSARNVAEYWDMLAAGRMASTRLSDEALLASGVSRATLADPNYVKIANILPDMESFDAGFFGFSPKEAAILDPQHRHFLETCWEALEDSGHMPENFDGRIGVYAGSGMQAYMPYNLLSNPELVEEIGLFLLRHTGNDKDFLTTRASYLLNLTGPSVAVQTACSTSLVATHVAVNALLSMECDMALAGGVTIELPHRVGYRYAEGEILSPDGLCRAFDDDSQGTVFGSGSALVVLRRMEDALADGDDIKAVILGSAINNDGSSKANYLAPSVEGQAEAAGEAVALAGVDPRTISYIEAHGTGTPIGDPIELAALNEVYGDGDAGSIGIGSVKSNIGHLDTAAGGASLIKVVEALRHKWLPASVNFKTPNSRFDFTASPFRVVAEGQPWRNGAAPRRAAVNSLGVGGTNAHVIFEEAPERAPAENPDCWRIFSFSARDDAALDRTAGLWGKFLDRQTPALHDMSYTLRKGRRQFPARMAVAARTRDDLKAALAGSAPSLIRKGKARDAKPNIVFMYPGGGAQYPGAGAEMLENAPAFATAVEACYSELPSDAPADLHQIMFSSSLDDDAARRKLARSSYAIPALFILEYAYTKLWESWGITPDAILAHSVGEYAAAVASGAMALKDALKIVVLRGQVMDAAPTGAMTTVPAHERIVRDLIGDALDIAALNAPEVSVVSGRIEDIVALESRLKNTCNEARRIQIDVAAHSRVLDGQLERFRAGFEGVDFGTPNIPMISSMRGDWSSGDDFVSADYWVRHLRQTVRFADAVARVLDQPEQIIIEVGPGQTLLPLVGMTPAAEAPRALLPSAPKPKDDASEMGVAMAALGGLWANGVALDWDRLPGTDGRRISLPTYAFDKTRHWIEPGRGTLEEADAPVTLTRRAQVADWFEEIKWAERALSGPAPELAGDWVIFAGDCEMSQAVLAKLRGVTGARITIVRPGAGFAKTAEGYDLRPDAPEDHEALIEALGETDRRYLHLWPPGGGDGQSAFDSAYLLLRAMQLNDAGNGSRLVFAAQLSGPDEEQPKVLPEAALLIGPVRVASREIPGLGTALVHFESGDPDGLVSGLLAEAAGASNDDEIALLEARRLVRTRTRSEVPAPDGLPSRLRQGGVYLITGGSGGIGRKLALWLARTAGARLAILSRSASDDPNLTDAIAQAGGEVLYLPVDVTDRATLSATLDKVRTEWGTIHGVIHAAGTIDDAPLSVKSLREAHAVMAAKVDGARILSELLPDGTLDLFAVFSSSSVEIGPAGQTDYVAANAYLEALAEARSDGLSIAWGIWRDTGMAARSYGAGVVEDGPHPLLGPRENAANGEIVFTRRMDTETDWVIAEHVVGGQPVLPGTAYVEMATAAASDVMGEQPFEIHDLSFEAAMVFTDAMPRRVSVYLVPSGDGFDLRIESAVNASAAPVVHARARIVAVLSIDSSLQDSFTIPAGPVSQSRRSGHAPQETLIEFGPRWRNTGDVHLGTGMAEGEFALPPQFMSDLKDGYKLHPALIDMAMTVGLHRLDPSAMEGVVYAPMSIERIRVLAAVPSEVTSRAILRQGSPDRLAVFDVVVSSALGQVLLVLENLVMRAVEGGALRSDPEPHSLTEQLLATGIRESDADSVFTGAFNSREKSIVVSPVALEQVRLAMAEVPRPQKASVRPVGKNSMADPLAAALADIWSALLGVEAVGPDDDFFALGGHSLNAVRLFNRIRKDFDVDLPLALLYEAPTVTALASSMRTRGYQAETSPETSGETVTALTKVSGPQVIEMTEGQREVYSAILFDPQATLAYNLSYVLKIDGPLDAEALARAFGRLVARHDSLRARFDSKSLKITIEPESELILGRVDLADLPPSEQPERRDEIYASLASEKFDLEHGPMLRTQLIKFEANRHELLIAIHHIVCDGWSIGVVMRELAELYNAEVAGREPDLPPAESIVEFVTCERDWLSSPQAAAHRDYWMRMFADSTPVMDLPTDRPRPPVRTTRTERLDKLLDPALESLLRTQAEEMGSSLQNFVFAAFQLFLSHLTGSRDVVVGLPSAGQLSYGLEGVVGHCVNFLPIRTRIPPQDSFRSFMAQVRNGLLEALDHQNYTYGTLVKDLNIPRDPSRLALVPVIMNIDNLSDVENLEFTGLETEFSVNPTGNELFELFFNLLDAPGRVRFSWSYNSDLFNDATIAQQLAQFVSLLEGLVEAPETRLDKIGSFLSGEIKPASGSHEDPGAAGPQTITEVFAQTAARHRKRTAVRFGDTSMDYATLDDRSDALAARLVGMGVQTGELVGISSHRSLELMVAVIGVLKAGAGYLPFDASLPAERLVFMAKDTAIKVLLGTCDPVTATGVTTIPLSDLPDGPADAPQVQVSGDDVAYVMFTSGTTGIPKGVMLPHRSVIRMLVDTNWLRMSPKTVTLHSSAFAFDTSIIDIFAALLHGGTVVIPPDGLLSISDLSDAIASNGVNTLWLTSGLFHAVADTDPQVFANVDQVIVGGDVVSPLHVARIMDACPGTTVINGYGPTESNVTSAHVIRRDDLASGQGLSIGQAIPGTQIYILDDAQNPVPPGIQGELCIAGRGLALGYWNRPELTAEKFINAPWDHNLKLYRSGDLAMDPGDGTLRFFGRQDTQVKVRGFRVELTGVEGALESHPDISQATVVTAVPEGQADKVLVAYFVAKDTVPSRRSLAEHMKAKVPEYARPGYFVPLEKIPLNQNGKVDRQALPPVTPEVLNGVNSRPQNRTEEQLTRIWRDVLKLTTVGTESNFFELGGHSLLAVRLFDRIREEFSLVLPISTLFQNPTIRDLAGAIEQTPAAAIPVSTVEPKDDDWDTTTVIDPGPGTGERALFIVGGVGGNLNNLIDLGKLVGRSRPVIGFQTRGILGHTLHSSIEEMAAEHIRYMQSRQPHGPYLLAGYSGGAHTAFEMARQLKAMGETVGRFFVLDTYAPGFAVDFHPGTKQTIVQRLRYEKELLEKKGLSHFFSRTASFLRSRLYRGPVLAALRYISPSRYRYQNMVDAWFEAARRYKGGIYDGEIILFKAEPSSIRERLAREKSEFLGWKEVATSGRVQAVKVTGDHKSMVSGAHAERLAQLIELSIKE